MPETIISTRLPRSAPARVLACGAYLKNRACLIDGNRARWSTVHGDLGNATNRLALEASIKHLLSSASGPVQAVAHDLHPDFHSSRVALSLATELAVPAIAVQHHHAHVGVVLAEQGIAGPVIGIALDGFGLGADGSAWGGELLSIEGFPHAHQWQRRDHLAGLAQPGADAAAREPWRLAAAVMFKLGQGNQIENRFAAEVGKTAARAVHRMLERDLNCPPSTSTGRWFDAAAGILGLNLRQSFEAEAAIKLESEAQRWLARNPAARGFWRSLDLYPVLAQLAPLADQGPDARARGAALFHLALATALAFRATELADSDGIRDIVLSGGCMANLVLSSLLQKALNRAGLRVYQPRQAGCGDVGLALGQAWIAACAMTQHNRIGAVSLLPATQTFATETRDVPGRTRSDR